LRPLDEFSRHLERQSRHQSEEWRLAKKLLRLLYLEQ